MQATAGWPGSLYDSYQQKGGFSLSGRQGCPDRREAATSMPTGTIRHRPGGSFSSSRFLGCFPRHSLPWCFSAGQKPRSLAGRGVPHRSRCRTLASTSALWPACSRRPAAGQPTVESNSKNGGDWMPRLAAGDALLRRREGSDQASANQDASRSRSNGNRQAIPPPISRLCRT